MRYVFTDSSKQRRVYSHRCHIYSVSGRNQKSIQLQTDRTQSFASCIFQSRGCSLQTRYCQSVRSLPTAHHFIDWSQALWERGRVSSCVSLTHPQDTRGCLLEILTSSHAQFLCEAKERLPASRRFSQTLRCRECATLATTRLC